MSASSRAPRVLVVDDYRLRAFAAGFDQHVLKPTDAATLRAILESAARGSLTSSDQGRA